MNLILAKEASNKGTLPVALPTIYKWHSQKRHPALVVKVANKLFVDLDEWNRMGEQAVREQVKKAQALKNIG